MTIIRRALLPFAQRFVAGERVETAVEHARDLNADDVTAYINLLGEHLEERAAVTAAREEYLALLDTLDAEEVDGGLSVKPTQLGLEIDEELCRENTERLLQRAAERNRFVWIDMESSAHTEETINLYMDLWNDHDNVGVCIQSTLKRSRGDVARILEEDGIIRLVKGAYSEPAEVAYQEKEEVDRNFARIMHTLFASDASFAVATHDAALLETAKDLVADHSRARDSFEFQLLMGVKDGLERQLAADGYCVGEYVPYGPEWLSYYWRRVRERKENLFFAVRAVLGL